MFGLMGLALDAKASLSISGSPNCANERDYFLVSVCRLLSRTVTVDLEKLQLQRGRKGICITLKNAKALLTFL